ncbi:phenylacetic acid degradation-related protein [Syntrophobotulus glycolicus DSM 8271]|uniref:Phenylacetic acid degradation-related protein n=1 Tax=Syntrophobotulus glycolicus (strain DSM 8271 / FlGlyR) TaxID=645991 RepID=F0SY96_SYNGF|nr:PaaI family thioesterase [Syntrophobotulus glycolicus]ADY55931.1 phenylacetic acid degradation-related protein [Syntrophobotulus glycolicus DSM 8271]
MNKIIKFFEKDQFAAMCGIKLIEARPGYALARVNISEDHLNAVRIVQGGLIFTLADLAFAAAINSYGQVAVSISSNISYFKSARGGELLAEAKEVSVNQKLANYDIEIFDENKELIAKFNGTAYIKKEQIDFEK